MLQSSSLTDVDVLRALTMKAAATSVEEAAQAFALNLTNQYSSIVLSRVFAVLPYKQLPAPEQAFAAALASEPGQLRDETPILTLLGTSGHQPDWRKRTDSKGHRAIPLLGVSHVQSIPMVAKLLADLEVDFSGLDQGKPIETRRLLGSKNGAFFVPNAPDTRDAAGRHVIPSADFVREHDVHTVFGMGGAYLDGTLVISINFTSEHVDRAVAGLFASLISNFKMATAALLQQGRVFQSSM